MELMRFATLLGNIGGFTLGTIVLVGCLLLIWYNTVSTIAVRFTGGKEATLLTEILHLATGLQSIQAMNLANVVCFAIMILLVVLVSLLDEAMIIVKESIEAKAKLPSSEIVRHINHSYERGLARGGIAHKAKQMKRVV
ncbi:uncharacterized protein TM35_000042430 [Trypanosoma theileri]|uniref:Uncharacterized protein n=1 Tax=Trypanosoma theileri TaxID=67003 RepID=A0A1X0P643_9TRYP|nr:uncharacterized protein TM35_000042430 [Trypanosoma theileri]ORC92029.1 hypothetical protein TM35_000042430 [Trypanosoma theileri]